MERIRGIPALSIVGRVFLILGMIGLLAAGVLTAVELHGGRSAQADGTIVEAAGRAKVRFTTSDGEGIEIRNDVTDTMTRVGDHVPIAYDPADPHGAKVDAFAGRWFLRDLFGGLGGAFLLTGAGLTLVGRLLAQRGR